jgi:endonuclease YncB( thermonuclease family)
MHRAFVEKGVWRVAVATACDPSQQKMATLRVSALAGLTVLGLIMGPDFRQTELTRHQTPVIVSTAPDMVSFKDPERVAGHASSQVSDRDLPLQGDITSTAPTRRWRPQTDPNVIVTPKPIVHDTIEVVDASTLRAGGMVVRLTGMIAPDEKLTCRRLDGLTVPCVDRAISYLQLLVKGRAVACERAGVAGDGVEKGHCRIGDSDIAEQMIRQGWAKADAQPEQRFLLAQASARKQKLGIWR